MGPWSVDIQSSRAITSSATKGDQLSHEMQQGAELLAGPDLRLPLQIEQPRVAMELPMGLRARSCGCADPGALHGRIAKDLGADRIGGEHQGRRFTGGGEQGRQGLGQGGLATGGQADQQMAAQLQRLDRRPAPPSGLGA